MPGLYRPPGEGIPLAFLEVPSGTIFYTKRAKHVLLGCKGCFDGLHQKDADQSVGRAGAMSS